MKPTILLTLSFLIFAFTSDLQLAFSRVVEQVKDTNGNPLLLGGWYFIRPATRGASGGGVGFGKTDQNSTCPITVLQSYSDTASGTSVEFSIPGTSTGTISTGTPLEIKFVLTPVCAESGKWTVVDDDDFPRRWVSIGGGEDHPGKGSFNIETHGLAYKLVFCPPLTIPYGGCFDIGRYNDKSNGRRLILADGDPYQVEFVNAGTNGIRSVV